MITGTTYRRYQYQKRRKKKNGKTNIKKRLVNFAVKSLLHETKRNENEMKIKWNQKTGINT